MKKILIRSLCIIVIFALFVGTFFAYNVYARKKIVDAYEVPIVPSSIDEQYDVIVISGEPEGVAAAVSAARNGAKTLLIEEKEELGGLFTYGMLNFLLQIQACKTLLYLPRYRMQRHYQ